MDSVFVFMNKSTNIKKIKEYIGYDPKTGIFYRKKLKNGKGKLGVIESRTRDYSNIHVLGKSYKSHRLAWLLYYGEKPSNYIDHINGDKKDNRICNLRDILNSENCQNRIKTKYNRTGFLGVIQISKRRWSFSITKDRVIYRGGVYLTPGEAYGAYLERKKELHIPTLLTM